MTSDSLWYKDAIIYQLHVKAFFDSNNDGIGDFNGLTRSLDYIRELGVTAIWLLPFYPSPLRDDGYDIADYRDVNHSYGSMRDFREFVREAHKRDLRIVTELVINHTSDQHPWFQRARTARPGSARRNFYVWSDDDQKYGGTRIIFRDTEISNWAWDPVAHAYYWHRFYAHQPDLNFDNPRVLDAIVRAMHFWLDMGVDGLRLDAIPYLCEREGTNNENLDETHEVIRRIRAALDARYPDRMLLAEANQWPEDVRPYFGEGDECHMAFHFPLMPRIYMALAREDRHPVTDIMRQTPEIPDNCQWAIFLRNHDELTLEMVTDRERDYLWNYYASDRRARINLGIRRRLAPLLENDRRKIELLNSLLMSMPGTPVLYYGDEIGMGDNVFLGDRDGVRTPMQWSPDRNGGFSRADPALLYLPPIGDPVYGYEAVNVEAQGRSPSSLLSWMKRLITVRKRYTAFARGSLTFLYPGNRKVLVYLRKHEKEVVLCVANMSGAPQPVELDLSEYAGRVPLELVGQSPFPPVGQLPYFVTLASYGFYWFLLAEETDAPAWHEDHTAAMPEFLTLVLPAGLKSLLTDSVRQQLEQHIVPSFLRNQRWFAGKDSPIQSVRLARSVELADAVGAGAGSLLASFDVTLRDEQTQSYLLPLAITWESAEEDPLATLLPFTLARGRRGPNVSVIHDATAAPDFTRALLQGLEERREVAMADGGVVAFRAGAAFDQLDRPSQQEIQRLGREQSNVSVVVGEVGVLKILRRLQAGIHPEIEVGQYLTEAAGYANTPQYYGSVEIVDPDGSTTALAVLQAFVRNQGDAWRFTLDYLTRMLADAEVLSPEAHEEAEAGEDGQHAVYLRLANVLGARVGELHQAFAIDSGDPAFQPEPVRKKDIARWGREVHAQARDARKILQGISAGLPDETKQQVRELLRSWSLVERRIGALLPPGLDTVKTRCHGDLHLGQVLLSKDDFYIIDFEGEPLRPIDERRQKHMPLRDVAGMLRSFDYAARAAVLERKIEDPRKQATAVELAIRWQRLTREAFLDGYRSAANGCPSCPQDEATVQALIDFFELEKVLYEIRYEASNRPTWLHIPLASLGSQIGAGSAGGERAQGARGD